MGYNLNTEYSKFLTSKTKLHVPSGMDFKNPNPNLFDFQEAVIKWALKLGKACVFADCGLGKTFIELEWARSIPGKVLIVAPLAVSAQTIREAAKFGDYDIEYSGDGRPAGHITITNYERIQKFNPKEYDGVVLDESSILKSHTGKFRTHVIKNWSLPPYRLAATATPAPNDYMELANHSEFVGAMARNEMLASFFIHDGGETQKWRLKGHGRSMFWEWLCSWAIMFRMPSDIGFDDNGFVLPELNVISHVAEHKYQSDMLFPMPASTLAERRNARRDSIEERVALVRDITNNDEQWVIWCNLNAEANAAASVIRGAVNVQGSDASDVKAERMKRFADGDIRVLVTKPTIAGFGLNWQHCHNMAFLGLSDSYEQYYQAVRRCWRFGQKHTVNVNIVISDTEGAVMQNIKRKEADAENMLKNIIANTHSISTGNVHGYKINRHGYKPSKPFTLPKFMEAANA